jgi:hypothetical protein
VPAVSGTLSRPPARGLELYLFDEQQIHDAKSFPVRDNDRARRLGFTATNSGLD